MSGIAGILHLDGKEAQRCECEVMADALSHRGRDGIYFYNKGPVGMVQLQTFAAPRGSPGHFFSEDAVVLDGRIDNAAPLSEHLQKFASGIVTNMAELLLTAHANIHDFSPAHLLGDFAFALWDSRKQKLLLARDPAGVKPLYYSFHENRLLFASEAKGILAFPGVPRQPDPVRLNEFKTFRFVSPERTFFGGLNRLPGGDLLMVSRAGLEKKSFYQPDTHYTIRLPSHKKYAEQFREIFLEAVRCRLPETGTAAIALSGGVDSSSIACAAAKIQREERPGLKLHALSFYSRNFADEREWIKTVCRHCSIPSTALYFEDLNPLAELGQAIHAHEDPTYDIIDANHIALYEKARALGARVLLTGDFGDQVLNGMAYPADFLRAGQFKRFFNELKLLPKNDGGSVREILHKVARYLLLPAGIHGRDEAMKHLLKHFLLPFQKQKKPAPAFATASQKEIYDEVFSIRSQMNLEVMDRRAAAGGISVRFPFLDRRLVEFLLAIPSEERIYDGMGKRILREALSELLPEETRKRNTKGDYTRIIHERLKALGFQSATFAGSDVLWQEYMLNIWRQKWFGGGEKTTYKNNAENVRTYSGVETVRS